MENSSKKLTKYPLASLREVATLSFSFIFVLFSASLMGFCDRLILARYSLEALETSISTFYLIQLFQIPCIRIASTAQIFVGQYNGAGKLDNIGSVIWQMIWFSLLSMLVVGPLSLPICELFFQNTAIKNEVIPCFRFLIIVNFLFPLGVALSTFYFGQGRTKEVFLASLASNIVHIVLDFTFIFGIKGFFSPLGARGAVFAYGIAQFFFCALLFWGFLRPEHRRLYGTAQFSFQ